MSLSRFYLKIDTQHKHRVLGLVFLCVFVFLLTKSDRLFLELGKLLTLTQISIMQHPHLGMVLFVIFSMLSAMLAFFSSAILVPIGVTAWGVGTCFVLLWIGWFLGGLFAYAIGYFAGSSVAALVVGEERLERLKTQLKQRTNFVHVLLFQAALPSEVPGYVLGSVKFRLDYYLVALALTELPYAIGTVYLGESFLQRNMIVFIAIFAIGLVFALIAYQLYKRHFNGT